MSVTSALGNQAKLLWQFLGFFQKPYLRFLHAIIAVLVILQILSSFAMHMLSSGQLNPRPQQLACLVVSYPVRPCSLSSSACCLRRTASQSAVFTIFSRTSGVIRNSSKRTFRPACASRWVPPRPKGLATAVQGLGLGALLLVVLSGLIWFILWRNGSSFAGLALETHKNVTLLIELYLIGHGCMALLHFFVWQRNKARQE